MWLLLVAAVVVVILQVSADATIMLVRVVDWVGKIVFL
jgi:hypothetical protein